MPCVVDAQLHYYINRKSRTDEAIPNSQKTITSFLRKENVCQSALQSNRANIPEYACIFFFQRKEQFESSLELTDKTETTTTLYVIFL